MKVSDTQYFIKVTMLLKRDISLQLWTGEDLAGSGLS